MLFTSLLLSGCAPHEDDLVRRPNIVIMLANDQGWGDLGYNGNTNVETPNMDRIARQGAQLTHFYVSPVCSPTRASLLSDCTKKAYWEQFAGRLGVGGRLVAAVRGVR